MSQTQTTLAGHTQPNLSGNHLTASAAQRLISRVRMLSPADRLQLLDDRGLRIRSVQPDSRESIVVNFDRLTGQQGFQIRVTNHANYRYAAFLQWQRDEEQQDQQERPGRRKAVFQNPAVTHTLIATISDVTSVTGRDNLYQAALTVNDDWLHGEETQEWTRPERAP